jgi:26S proteasome non-ATPase regulatory subunit 10
MAAAMEVDAGAEKPSEKELFLAAESGDADAFSALAPADLAAALSLRNEDGRSLLHVAAASGHPKAATLLRSIRLESARPPGLGF